MFGLNKYLLGGFGVALALVFAWGARVDHLRASWKAKYETLSGQASEVLTSIRLAADAPKLAWPQAAEQIRLLGDGKRQWQDTANLQSSRIDAMAAETARLKALSDDLRAKAAAAIAKRDTAIQRLDELAMTPGERADCAAQLIAAEQALDAVYREGL